MKQIKIMEIVLEVLGMLLALAGIASTIFAEQIGLGTLEDIVYFFVYFGLYFYCCFCFIKTVYRKS